MTLSIGEWAVDRKKLEICSKRQAIYSGWWKGAEEVDSGQWLFIVFHKQKAEVTENGDFFLFAANRKWIRKTSVCLLHTETENGHLFSLAGKW
jgi:hypothetical protein